MDPIYNSINCLLIKEGHKQFLNLLKGSRVLDFSEDRNVSSLEEGKCMRTLTDKDGIKFDTYAPTLFIKRNGKFYEVQFEVIQSQWSEVEVPGSISRLRYRMEKFLKRWKRDNYKRWSNWLRWEKDKS